MAFLHNSIKIFFCNRFYKNNNKNNILNAFQECRRVREDGPKEGRSAPKKAETEEGRRKGREKEKEEKER